MKILFSDCTLVINRFPHCDLQQASGGFIHTSSPILIEAEFLISSTTDGVASRCLHSHLDISLCSTDFSSCPIWGNISVNCFKWLNEPHFDHCIEYPMVPFFDLIPATLICNPVILPQGPPTLIWMQCCYPLGLPQLDLETDHLIEQKPETTAPVSQFINHQTVTYELRIWLWRTV